jgi:hypothetical protein
MHTEEVKSCIQRKDETLHSYIQRWSIIKNSAEDVSDERAVDAFSAGLRRSDLVEELGRTNPRTVSELMEVATNSPMEKTLMSTHASVLVDSVGPPSAEVCTTAASFP